MFEQQQNTGKSASLAEKYANAVGQLSDANDRAAHAEHDLQVERITRQDLIDEEVARRVAEAEERIRKELEAQLADKTKELEERNKALDKRESDVDKKAETIAQNVSEQVRQQMSAAKTRFEKTALNRLADMFDMFMQAFIALGDKDSSKGQELLQKYQLAAKEAHGSLTDEIKDKLAKVEAKNKSKSEQIASLVRMIFTQKRERVVFSKEERDTIYDKVMASVEFTDEEKKRYQECREFCEEYRKRKAIKKLLNSQKEQKGHGRNPIPEDMPRLEEKVLWPEGNIGHEDEYVIVYQGKVQEFIVPAKVRYFVQPYRRPVVRRKDDPMQKLLQSPCYEDVFWKSYASAELLAQLECNNRHLPDDKSNFTPECLGIGYQSISCSFYIFHLHLLHSSEVKILHINLAILGLWATTFSSTWTSIDIKETSIVTKAAYQREPFFLYPINKCTCREVSICNYEG